MMVSVPFSTVQSEPLLHVVYSCIYQPAAAFPFSESVGAIVGFTMKSHSWLYNHKKSVKFSIFMSYNCMLQYVYGC